MQITKHKFIIKIGSVQRELLSDFIDNRELSEGSIAAGILLTQAVCSVVLETVSSKKSSVIETSEVFELVKTRISKTTDYLTKESCLVTLGRFENEIK